MGMNLVRHRYAVCWFALLCQSALADVVYLDVSSEDEITISSQQDSDAAMSISDVSNTRQSSGMKAQPKIGTRKVLSLAAKYQSAQYQSLNTLPYHQEVVVAAKLTALEPALIHAVIAVESGHNPNARSHKGAFGLMQLMPATAQKFSTTVKDSPRQHILAGSKYLRELLNVFDGDVSLALAAYNAGPNAIKKYHGKIPPYAETQQYVPKVLGHFQHFSLPLPAHTSTLHSQPLTNQAAKI